MNSFAMHSKRSEWTMSNKKKEASMPRKSVCS